MHAMLPGPRFDLSTGAEECEFHQGNNRHYHEPARESPTRATRRLRRSLSSTRRRKISAENYPTAGGRYCYCERRKPLAADQARLLGTTRGGRESRALQGCKAFSGWIERMELARDRH